MKPMTKVKGNIMGDYYTKNSVATTGNGIAADTSFAVIKNAHVEVLLTERKFTLIGFNHDLFKKYILIGSSTATIGLPNGAVSANMD